MFVLFFRYQINKLEKSHGGMYACFNLDGDWSNLTLRVRPPKLKPENLELLPQPQKLKDIKPKFINTASMLTHIQKPEGMDLNLSCAAAGTPDPKVRFTKNGYQINREWGPIYFTRHSIRLQNLVARDAGAYTCHACNDHGCTNFTTNVDVIPLAKRVESMSHVKEEEIDTNLLPYNQSEKDLASNGILRDKDMMDEDDDYEYLDEISTEKPVNQKNTTPKQAKEKQQPRPNSMPVFVNTNKMEHIISKPSGNTVMFNCKAMGDPEPVVKWTKNNETIVRRIGTVQKKKWTLTLEDLIESDSGSYTCHVCNVHGCIDFTSKLQVVGELILKILILVVIFIKREELLN